MAMPQPPTEDHAWRVEVSSDEITVYLVHRVMGTVTDESRTLKMGLRDYSMHAGAYAFSLAQKILDRFKMADDLEKQIGVAVYIV